MTTPAPHPGGPAGTGAATASLFLEASGLPQRWAGRRHFVVLDTGFGLGHCFLATWRAWRQDAQRCEHLFFVASMAHPPSRDDLARAHAGPHPPGPAEWLQQAWPPLTANLHALHFEGGRVRLLLGVGGLAPLLRELQVSADALFLAGDGMTGDGEGTPAAWDRRIFKALARRAAPGATAVFAGVAGSVRDGLAAAGFEVANAPESDGRPPLTQARYAPRFVPRAPRQAAAGHAGDAGTARRALVIGAGLAGASAAAALAGLGWQVQVIDRHAAPAAETSGNPAGLFHGTVHAGDGPHARLFRAAALAAERAYRPLIEEGQVAGQAGGLLRLQQGTLAAMQALLDAQGLPPAYVQALDGATASARAGVAVPGPAWFYPGGGWLAPAALVRHWLAVPGVSFRGRPEVAAVRRQGQVWGAFDGHGSLLAQAPVLVLANAGDAGRLLALLGHEAWPLQRVRGQVSGWAGGAGLEGEPGPPALKCPLAGDGYALPLPGGGVLCGATATLADEEAGVRAADQQHNFERLRRLTGLLPPTDPARWFGRVGWRAQTDDRLPVAGAVPLPEPAPDAAARPGSARDLERTSGLWVLNGLGARGITLAPLLGELLAAQIDGAPWPLERSLADAVDPARWRLRRARRVAG